MDFSIFLEYGGVLIILIILEGLLAVDNAVVLAVMVKHLDPVKRKKALFYGLLGAFVFRFLALLAVSILIKFWFIQGIGAAYLLFMAINNIYRKMVVKKIENEDDSSVEEVKPKKQRGFWATVFMVEIADIAFAIDSILAAIALSASLPKLGGHIGGMDAGQFLVVFTGGMIGVIIMRFAAGLFVELLEKRPTLETVAFFIVGWVGVKLVVLTLSHESLHIIPKSFAEGSLWKSIFYGVLIFIAVFGWFLSGRNSKKNKTNDSETK